MRWKINNFIFCDQQQTLSESDNVMQLEPMVVELLRYFCERQNEIISKDELIEQVWLGRYVSDNAVSKSITKLRKAFGDDARKPTFIATFPKKGYKFIALAEKVEDRKLVAPSKSADASDNIPLTVNVKDPTSIVADSSRKQVTSLSKFQLIMMVLLAFTIVLFSRNILLSKNELSPTTGTIKLTSDAGSELFPAFSNDGSRVAYLSLFEHKYRLKVKRIVDGKTIVVSHGESLGTGPASWRKDGKMLAYLVADAEQCQYFIREITDLDLGEPKLIHNCPKGSYGKIVFTHDNDRLVYTESNGENSSYSMFELTLSTGEKKRLNQPALHLAGNNQFDLHPTENKLLISSPDAQQWEGFYALDLESNTLSLLFKLNSYVCCGIWSHDGKRVVVMGEHPAFNLISYDFSGRDKHVIHAGSRSIRAPKRHVNGQDYLFSSGDSHIDIFKRSLNGNEMKVIADTSLDERYPRFANTRDLVAYVSLESGSEEIWITDSEGKNRYKLTAFNDDRHYIDLLFSPNDNALVALSLNEIHIVEPNSGDWRRVKIPQKEIRGVSFKDENTLSYSVENQGVWQVHWYDLTNNTVTLAPVKWQFIRYDADTNQTLWLDTNNELFVGAEPKPVNFDAIESSHLLNGRQFNLQKKQENWYWYERNDGGKIMHFSETTAVLNSVARTDVSYFDVRQQSLLFSQRQSGNVDIYQTQRAPQ